ncbi:MAG TPA: PQQ-binding-like beta-propeller repeat protein, partial [Thermoguttaceae bacterium]|nr:PQQ-binding-like beta-propeller repeat protein [Thermoguttaceae bacterium]
WVFAMFATADVVAFDLDGTPAWRRSLGIPDNVYGHASSPIVYKNLLLIQLDQATKKAAKSKLLALDVATGETVWETAREMPNSWPTPIVIHHADRDQIITAGDPWVIAYDPADGSEIWRVKCLQADIGPSPTFADGVVFVASEFPYLTAVRADGTGDVTETHILWQGEDGLPDTAGPVADGQFVYLLASFGLLTCYDAKSGEFLWEQEFEDSFTSSPSMVGERLYLFGLEGKCWVVKPSRDGCEIIAENKLGGEEKDDIEECVTSPAFQEGRLFIRGNKHLFCIGQP